MNGFLHMCVFLASKKEFETLVKILSKWMATKRVKRRKEVPDKTEVVKTSMGLWFTNNMPKLT